MKTLRLRLAFAGLHPDRTRSLVAAHGLRETLAGLQAGRLKANERVQAAIAVPAGERTRQLEAMGVRALFCGDDDYPQHLAVLPDAPDVLFVRGRFPAEPGVAVVGARRSTNYGRRLAADYGSAIAAAGWPVVSGLARGIDGAAHRGTTSAGGVGVAVLGSGIDIMYPREHDELARLLIERGGAVVSESPPGTPPEGWRFPPRNRVISGLAGVVVVVEATVKGGALITAEAALRHGRQVFAVPGDVGRVTSEGCNLLIRDGAYPVLDEADLIESLELALGPRPRAGRPGEPPVLDEDEQRLVDLIAAGTDDGDRLIAEIGCSPGVALARLGSLEMRGVIAQDGPGRYVVATAGR
ncbi:MAG: DNA-processing protein DprA [Acidimicrobiia bacterium]|nr:DNA-processing protein DprA [Acidimicrobiia bacterium]